MPRSAESCAHGGGWWGNWLSRRDHMADKRKKITQISQAHAVWSTCTEGGVVSVAVYLGADEKCDAVDHMDCNITSEELASQVGWLGNFVAFLSVYSNTVN